MRSIKSRLAQAAVEQTPSRHGAEVGCRPPLPSPNAIAKVAGVLGPATANVERAGVAPSIKHDALIKTTSEKSAVTCGCCRGRRKSSEWGNLGAGLRGRGQEREELGDGVEAAQVPGGDERLEDHPGLRAAFGAGAAADLAGDHQGPQG